MDFYKKNCNTCSNTKTTLETPVSYKFISKSVLEKDSLENSDHLLETEKCKFNPIHSAFNSTSVLEKTNASKIYSSQSENGKKSTKQKSKKKFFYSIVTNEVTGYTFEDNLDTAISKYSPLPFKSQSEKVVHGYATESIVKNSPPLLSSSSVNDNKKNNIRSLSTLFLDKSKGNVKQLEKLLAIRPHYVQTIEDQVEMIKSKYKKEKPKKMSRVELLAIPKKGRVLDTWKSYRKVLQPEALMRLNNILQNKQESTDVESTNPPEKEKEVEKSSETA